MDSDKKLAKAQAVYSTLCDAIDRRNWTYDKLEDKLVAHFKVSGDDIPMQFIIIVDADRQLIRVLSPLPFKMSEGKRVEGAIATCEATYRLADGSFDYDMKDGSITFRLTASFADSLIGEELFQYIISCSCSVVDQYNDKFMAIDKGYLSVDDFLARK